MPSVLLISTSFTGLAANQAKVLGMPNLPCVVLPHPLGGTPLDSVLAKVDKAFDEIVAKLTTPLQAGATASAARTTAERVEIACEDEYTDLQAEFLRRNWGDGLPLVPPTEEAVAEMLTGTDLPPQHVVGKLVPGSPAERAG